ncbi:hypothetical protein LX32DRAFT_567563 [Colletotrichum zoysiae]|uniref:Uncharacterized protein n=1 Tax=Colletotrichum zoysiae TaxID=1216348 RepID=A0AAD9HB97_9PEZI|nr:hypothetical protein LX32DRAFT_567563 [Colletotrichum zoysiae]
MKTSFLLLLAGAATLATAGAAADPDNTAHVTREEAVRHDEDDDTAGAPPGETVTLRRRDCDIACPVDRRYCYYAPYNYKCDGRGRFTWSQRDTNCELPTTGCWCFCDWRPRSGGGVKIVRESGVPKDLD